MRPRHQLVDRSNVASCAMMDDQISVSGKYLSPICVIVVHPLSILISEDIFAYNDLYFIVLSVFWFPLWVICLFCWLDCNNNLLFHLYLGRLANFVSYTFKILVSRWRTTNSYKLRIMSWPLISLWYLDFDICFFYVFCVPGVGTLNLIWRFFDARPMGVLQKFWVTDTNPHKSPTLPTPPPPVPGFILIGA